MSEESNDKLFTALYNIVNHNQKYFKLENIDMGEEVELMVLKVFNRATDLEVLLLDGCTLSFSFFTKLIKFLSSGSSTSLKRIIIKSQEELFIKGYNTKFWETGFYEFKNLQDLSLERNGLTVLPKL